MRKVLRKLPPKGDAPGPSEDPPRPEIPKIDWDAVEPEPPVTKKMISMRLDADVIAFFQSEGRGYQTRMNAVLRSYMAARKSAG